MISERDFNYLYDNIHVLYFGIWWDKTKGSVGLTRYTGVGSGTGGHGFYKEGATAGDGSWFVGVLKDIIPEENAPLSRSNFNDDPDWPLNKVFNKLDTTDREAQGDYALCVNPDLPERGRYDDFSELYPFQGIHRFYFPGI